MKTEPTEALELKKSIQYGLGIIDAGSGILSELSSMVEDVVNIAFSEGQSSPKIKQLEWRYDEEFFIWEANSVFGKYSFVDNSLIVNKKLFFRGKEIAIVLTIDEAKAAAQADFEKRVKECLE